MSSRHSGRGSFDYPKNHEHSSSDRMTTAPCMIPAPQVKESSPDVGNVNSTRVT